MIINKSKHCNGCMDRVALKQFILWHTVKGYVTIRGDRVPGYANYEDNTTPVKVHYCTDCWKVITENLPFESEVLPF